MIKLKNTKTGEIIEMVLEKKYGTHISEFYQRFMREYNKAIEVFVLNSDYMWGENDYNFEIIQNDFEKNIIENWNRYSEEWTSPRGYEPVYKMLEWQVDFEK